MLIVMQSEASRKDVEKVLAAIAELGLTADVLPDKTRTTIVVAGNCSPLDAALFESFAGVAETIQLTESPRLGSLEHQPQKSIVKIGKTQIGADELAIIAGVCAVENREQVFAVAETVRRSGARLFRGGAFKPRTSPYAFQGLGEAGLKILAEARDSFGLSIVTEAMDERGMDLVERYADCIQIGARNMQNFSLLKRAGKSVLPVLLKRGMSATLDDLLNSAEYILAEGNKNVILCERGIRTFADHARNTLDLSIVPAIKRVSHLPVIVDPSHGTGKNFMVAPLAQAAVAVGADGLLIEIHPEPAQALSDGSQALTPAQYLELVERAKAIHEIMSPAFA